MYFSFNTPSAAEPHLGLAWDSPRRRRREVDALPSCLSASIPAPRPLTPRAPEEEQQRVFEEIHT